jgi:hypothetical protein
LVKVVIVDKNRYSRGIFGVLNKHEFSFIRVKR